MHAKRYLCAVFTVLLFTTSIAQAKKRPRFIVQVIAQASDQSGFIDHVYLVLPNGSHAIASCGIIAGRCRLESFAPEKRKTALCATQVGAEPLFCFAPEAYYATREGNEITILDPAGPKLYHIDGSFDELGPYKPAP
jgi:hypothetical protein